MAVKLNLLPPGVGVTGSMSKALNTTRMLGVIALAFFLLFTLGISGFFILNTVTLNNLNSDVDSLKSRLASLQTVETQTVLLKDRLGKIKTAFALPDSRKNLDAVNPLLSGLGPSATLSELNVDPAKADISLTFTSNADTSAFMSSLAGSQNFASATLTTYSFSPVGGILVGVRIVPK